MNRKIGLISLCPHDECPLGKTLDDNGRATAKAEAATSLLTHFLLANPS